MHKPYYVSVCMMVKDEESNLERCLDSLVPVMNQISIELIVVDTGSTDRTVEIARRYTDKVYFHEWNHHFSEMRNITISYAQGEWIFILDADEEIDDPQAMLALLRSEQMQKANTVRLQARNTLSYKVPKDIFHVTERFFRNDGDFCYKGSVHNQPFYKAPILNTDVLINHYGYNNDDLDLMEKKFKRTSALLIKELQSDPNNIYYLYQLSRSYLMHKDLKEALEYIEKAYNLIKESDDALTIQAHYYVIGEYARVLCYNDLYHESILICNETIAISPEYIDMYFYKGRCHFALSEMAEMKDAYEQVLHLYDNYLKGSFDINKFTLVEMHALDPKVITGIASHVIDYYYMNNEFEDAYNYLDFMDECWEKWINASRVYMKLNKFEQVAQVYNGISDKEKRSMFVKYIEKEKQTLEDMQIVRLSEALSKGEDVYAHLNKIHVADNKSENILSFLKQYDLEELPAEPYALILNKAIEYGIPLELYLKRLSDSQLKKYVQEMISLSEQSSEYFRTMIIEGIPRPSDFHSNRILTGICNVLLLLTVEETKLNNKELFSYEQIFDKYMQVAINYVSFLYNMDNIRMVYRTLDNFEHKFYVLLHLARKAWDSSHHRNAIDYYQQAADCYPYFAKIIKQLVMNAKSDLQKKKILLAMEQDTASQPQDMKILQGTIEIANQMSLLSLGLNQLGVNSKSMTYYPNYLKYYSDYSYDSNANSNRERVIRDIEQISNHAIEHFDIFHFHFGMTLRPDFTDLPLLKQAGKSALMHYWGSEVRLLSVARKFNPYVVVKATDEDAIRRRLALLGESIENCVVADYELYQYVKDYHKHTHLIKQTIDLETYRPLDNFKFRKKKPVVVHAPTSPEIKGTQYILQSVEKLKNIYDFEFVLVQNKSHEEARKIYQQADIVLDELLCGSYGILAIESMAMGKPVITYINDFVREHYPQELPLVTANPDTVERTLLNLLKDWDWRVELGQKGRKYVEVHHDVLTIAKQFVDLYSEFRK